MRQHYKIPQGSTKGRRRATWENGKKILLDLIKNREGGELTKATVRTLFVQARKIAHKQYKLR